MIFRSKKAIFSSSYNYIFQMQGLTAHLRRKNLQILEQQLSLPKIPEKVPLYTPQTSARSRKSKPAIKYVSQTTMSPEQEHIQDQIRLVLQKQTRNMYSPLKIPDGKQKKQGNLLPKIKSSQQTNKKEVIDHKPRIQEPLSRKIRSKSAKFDLDAIFRDQSAFIENYFAEMSSRIKK